MQRINLDFEQTLRAMESGLHVEQIAEFDLRTCRPADHVSGILGNPDYEGYDQIPVRNGAGIIGVLERNHSRGKERVEETMQPLDSSMLVATSHPVGSLLDRFGRRPYRLVVKGNDIEGIVTQSDFLKLPVRLYAFMLITHLEMRMAAYIRQEFRGAETAWLTLLSPGRRESVETKGIQLKAKRHDPDLVELTDLCDKREILRKRWGLEQPFQRDLEDVQDLRNSVAHAGNYLAGIDDLEQFLNVVRVTKHYAHHLRPDMVPRTSRRDTQQAVIRRSPQPQLRGLN